MRFSKQIILLMIMNLYITHADGRNNQCGTQQTVPFDNLILNPNCFVQATYSFGNNAIIFCYTNLTQNAGQIAWPYNGTIQSGSLPIFLKTNPNFEGSFADPNGQIVIENDQPTPLLISCDFGF